MYEQGPPFSGWIEVLICYWRKYAKSYIDVSSCGKKNNWKVAVSQQTQYFHYNLLVVFIINHHWIHHFLARRSSFNLRMFTPCIQRHNHINSKAFTVRICRKIMSPECEPSQRRNTNGVASGFVQVNWVTVHSLFTEELPYNHFISLPTAEASYNCGWKVEFSFS